MKNVLRVMVLLFGLSVFNAASGNEQSALQGDPMQIVATILDKLDTAWTAGDGEKFAAQFTDDADVINIFGVHFQGKKDVAERMKAIFTTIFKGSAHKARNLEIARYLSDNVIIAVSSAVVSVPSGPLAPEARNRQTFILVKSGDHWEIRHWHNTPISDRP